jgi:hypothetical protein
MTEPLPAHVEVQVLATGRRGVIVDVLTEADEDQETTWYIVDFGNGERQAYRESQIRWVRQTFKAGALWLTSPEFQARLRELRQKVLGR